MTQEDTDRSDGNGSKEQSRMVKNVALQETAIFKQFLLLAGQFSSWHGSF